MNDDNSIAEATRRLVCERINDAEFFAQNPDRNFRIRLATPGEIAAAEIIHNAGAPLTMPADILLWVAVKQFEPGVCVHHWACASLPPASLLLNELPERIAREIFNFCCRNTPFG